MHFSALRGLTQPCLTAYCILHITYDPGISPGSANQCILGDVYPRSNLSRERRLVATVKVFALRWQILLLQALQLRVLSQRAATV